MDAWPLNRATVSGVGSLPFRQFEAALRYVRSTASKAPYLPELPRRYGASMLASIDAPPGSLDSSIERFLAQRPEKCRLLKFQVCGPLTYSLGRDLRIDRAAQRIGKHIEAMMTALRDANLPSLIVLDEPGLTGVSRGRSRGVAPVLRDLFDRIREDAPQNAPRFAGLHCCGNLDLQTLVDADPDLFSFDAWNALEPVLGDPSFRLWYSRRRALGLGVVPTRPPESRVGSMVLARQLAERTRQAFTESHLGESMPAPLLTGSCGFGLSTPTWTKRAHATLKALEKMLERQPIGS